MNFSSVIKEIEFQDTDEQEVFEHMANIYEKGLPDMLFRDPYELYEITGIHHGKWKAFLKVPQIIQIIESELALLAEIKARSALNRLGSEDIDTSTVSAIKALLEKSKLLQDKMTDHKQIIFHHIPLDEKPE